jgi:GT2 family glycosyltransferase
VSAARSDSPRVVVVILTMNQRALTLQCLASLRAAQSPLFATVVWDNGSDDGTAAAVRTAFPETLVHHEATNLGAAAGRNAAARLAMKRFNPSFFLFLDNDTVVAPDFLPPLLRPFDGDPKLGQIVPKLKLLDDPQRIDEAGTRIRFWLAQNYGIGHGELDHGQYDQPARCIAGGCCLVRVDVFQEVKGFDVRFDPYGWEDADFSLRIQKAGYYALYAPDSVILHKRSKTGFGTGYNKHYVKAKTRNTILFIQKHASLRQKFAFVLLGLPFLMVRALVREAKKGNVQALTGVYAALSEFWRSTRLTSRE